MRPRRWSLPLSAVLCLVLLTGCVGGTASAPSDPRSGGGLRYGLAPRPNQGATFQKDVVLVAGGASSVRSVTADGLTWTLSPDAGGIGDLKPGRVMFLTDRGVGRVRAIQTTSAGVEVTIGPVDLTDVIRDGNFVSKAPIPITNPVAISAAGAFWADPTLLQQAGVKPGSGADVPVDPAADIRRTPLPSLDRPPSPAAIVAETVKATTGAFDITASCCTGGPGAAFSYNKKGLSMTGRISLEMSKPTANFELTIAGGKVSDAGLTVTGAAGINAQLSAIAQPNSATNGLSPPLGTDFAFSVPIANAFFGVPLNMVVTQHFTVAVNIPGQARLDAVGEVKLSSQIGFRYHNNSYTNTTDAHLDSSASLAATNSIAVGISSAEFEYNVRFTVGLGYLGFVAGVFLALAVHLVSTVGAPFGINEIPGAENPVEHCVGVQGELWVDYGVGYEIPSSVVALVNYFLKAFQSAPIKTHGGFSKGWNTVLPTTYVVFPNTPVCNKKK